MPKWLAHELSCEIWAGDNKAGDVRLSAEFHRIVAGSG
jgi:hypothetical protein